jgi:hypothetical protein
MEAQYALQKKKPLVPLMLVEGYEADGWLGLMLGTSLWYALYGSTLTSEGAFEDRMDALCRELGDRGRADVEVRNVSEAVVPIVDAVGDEYSDSSDAQVTLRTELQSLRLKQLRHRAGAEGLDDDAIDDALDGDNPKAALIDLLVEREAARGPTERVLSTLEDSRDDSAEMLSGVLDHAIELLEQVSMSSPRKGRRSLRDISDRAEAVMESIDAEWCDGVSRCGREELDRLSSLIVRVRELMPSSAVSEVSDAVVDVIVSLDRCGSVAVQSLGLLNVDNDAESGPGLLGALESLRGLSESRLESVCADEAAAYEAVKRHLSGLESYEGAEVVSTCMALFTLGCWNGLSVCGTVEVLELSTGLYTKWLEAATSGGGAVDTGG